MRRPTTVLVTALVALALACTASAEGAVRKAIWGALTLNDGSPAFPVYKELGVDVFQIQLSWAQTATARPENPGDPADPAYRWPARVEEAVAQGAAHGIEVALMVRATPPWANGGREPAWAPDRPEDYAAFVAAAARRYPSVRRWMIWGEPTRQGMFEPMPQSSPVGPRRYALLLDAAYGALKGVNRGAIVIGGMSWTAGLVTPADFVRWMKLPNGRPPRLTLYGHNPFAVRFPKLSRPVYLRGIRDMSDIDTLHADLRRAYKGRRTPKLWLSEFTVSSDHANRAYNFAVSRTEQARWLTAAYRIANSVSYVDALGWYDLQDEAPATATSLTTGLLTADGTRKPAFLAYQRVR